MWLTTWVVILLTAGLSGISKAEQIFFSDFDGRPLRPFRVAAGISGEWARLPDVHSRPIPLFSEQYLLGSLAEAATLKLEGLPQHSSIDLDFLFAALDSWDGSTIEGGRAAPDFFNVSVDGELVFSETFDFALIDDQSFRPEPHVLAYRVEDFSIAVASCRSMTWEANPTFVPFRILQTRLKFASSPMAPESSPTNVGPSMTCEFR